MFSLGLLGGSAFAGSPATFAASSVVVSSVFGQRNVRSGDLDGDGDLDLLTYSNSGLFVHYNPGHLTTVWTLVQITSDSMCAATLGDLDRDGDLDLVGMTSGSIQLKTYIWSGTIHVASQTLTIADGIAAGRGHLELGDLDRDGDLDVIYGHENLTELSYNMNMGGSFGGGVAGTLTIISGIQQIRIGDLDSDGDLDVAAVTGTELAAYMNPGALPGAFEHRIAGTLTLSASNSLALADLDSDGELDLAAANPNVGGSEILGFKRDGSTFSPLFALTTLIPRALQAADLDADGDMDLQFVSNSRDIGWLQNKGSSWSFERLPGGPQSQYAAVGAADLNGDGREDYLYIDNQNGSLGFHQQNGKAKAHPIHWSGTVGLTMVGGDLRTVKSADIDRDGDLDLVVASPSGLQLLRNPGTLTLAWSLTMVDATPCYDVAIGDLDRDGDLDLVSMVSGELRTFNWSGTLMVQGPALTIVAGTLANRGALELGDLDRDGDLDVVFALDSTDEVSYSLWHAGTLQLRAIAGTLALNSGRSLQIGDMDRDGDLDIAAADSNKIVILNNPSQLTLAWPESNLDSLTMVGGDLVTIQLGDLDGDGDLDLAAGCPSLNEVRLYEMDSLTRVGMRRLTYATSGALRVGDIDGDGDLDLLVSNGSTQAGYFEFSGLTYMYRPSLTMVGGDLRTVQLGDLDGDGDMEIVYADNGLGQLACLSNETIHRSAHFSKLTHVSGNISLASSVSTGDLDGDGRADYLVASPSGLKWYRRSDGAETSITIAGKTGAAIGDLDGDGDLDVMSFTSSEPYQCEAHLNQGNGLAWNGAGTLALSSKPTDLRVADVDQDGDLDILVSSDTSTPLHLLRNIGGAGTLILSSPSIMVPTLSMPSSRIATGDLDGDGDLDVVCSPADGSTSIVAYLNPYPALSTEWTPLQVTDNASGHEQLALGDLDRDGRLDIVSVNHWSGTVVLHRSMPSLTYVGGDLFAFGAGERFVTLGDMDHDGDLDIITANGDNGTVHMLRNRGFDALTMVNDRLTIVNLTSVGGLSQLNVSDLDRDGDLDLSFYAPGAQELQELSNVGGQFALSSQSTAPGGGIPSGQQDDVLKITADHRGRSGETAVQLSTFELAFDDGTGAPQSTPLTSSQANAVIDEVHICRDANANNVYDQGADPPVASLSTLDLDEAGIQRVKVPNSSDSSVAADSSKTFFVVLKTTPNASSQIPSACRVTHITEASSTAIDPNNAAQLLLEFAPNTSSGPTPLPVTISGWNPE